MPFLILDSRKALMAITRKQVDVLTGLRGVAAYSVLIAHAISSSFIYQGVNHLQPLASRLAYFGMTLFFVLSGFVIYYNYADKIRDQGIIIGGYHFIAARIARLYPLYALVLFLTLDSIPSGAFHNKHNAELAYLTMTQSWFNFQLVFFPPAWSISTEWFFYFAFLFLMPLVELINRPRLILSLYLLTVFLLFPSILDFQISNFGNKNGWVTYFSPFTRVFDFFAGVLAARAYMCVRDRMRTINKTEYFVLILMVILCLLLIAFDPLRNTTFAVLLSNFLYTPPLAISIFLLSRFQTMFSRLLTSRLLLFIGEISYSVYLLGFMIITALAASYVNNRPTSMAYINSSIKVFSIVLLATFFAYGSYNLFEKPSRKFMRNLLMPKSKRVPEGAGLQSMVV